jgi:hypothetical protein
MTRRELDELLKSHGWQIDNFGHYHLKDSNRHYRFKMQDRSARLERYIRHSDQFAKYSNSKGFWYKVASDYYTKMVVLPDGVLSMDGKQFNFTRIHKIANGEAER